MRKRKLLDAGLEMDKCIAVEVFGWQWFPYAMSPDSRAMLVCPPDADQHIGTTADPPQYSTDIGAAWQILDALGGKVHVWRLLPNQWYAEIDRRIRWAETPALAICRVALEAIRAGRPDGAPA